MNTHCTSYCYESCSSVADSVSFAILWLLYFRALHRHDSKCILEPRWLDGYVFCSSDCCCIVPNCFFTNLVSFSCSFVLHVLSLHLQPFRAMILLNYGFVELSSNIAVFSHRIGKAAPALQLQRLKQSIAMISARPTHQT